MGGGGGARGREGVCVAGNLGGGGLNIFFRGRNSHQDYLSAPSICKSVLSGMGGGCVNSTSWLRYPPKGKKTVNYYTVVFFLLPPYLLRCRPFSEEKCL